jgi:hypothetical protein
MAALVSTREGTNDQEIWDQMADELVECIAAYLVPGSLESPWLSRPLSDVSSYYAQSSIGAAHWMQLSKALFRRGQRNKWELSLQRNRRCRIETTACCRIFECQRAGQYDCEYAELKVYAVSRAHALTVPGPIVIYAGPLEVLKLRASKAADSVLLSHSVPIARRTLRAAFCAVAMEVHPDRLNTPLAAQAMIVLNEAYRQAVIMFAERDTNDVIQLDALGLQHVV